MDVPPARSLWWPTKNASIVAFVSQAIVIDATAIRPVRSAPSASRLTAKLPAKQAGLLPRRSIQGALTGL